MSALIKKHIQSLARLQGMAAVDRPDLEKLLSAYYHVSHTQEAEALILRVKALLNSQA